jgi:hypothetical protein
MSQNSPAEDKPAWVQLYEARRRTPAPRVRRRGRPSRTVPRKHTSIYLAEGETEELLQWQEILSGLLDRKVSYGETTGILARMCTARLEALDIETLPKSLGQLVELMSGEVFSSIEK